MDYHTRDVRRPSLPTSCLDASAEDNLFDNDLQTFLDIADNNEQSEEIFPKPDYYAILGLPRSVCCATRKHYYLGPGINYTVSQCKALPRARIHFVSRHVFILVANDDPGLDHSAKDSQGSTQVILELSR